MSTPATPHEEGFEVVVGADGALTVPADELARRGVCPGAHLRLVQEPPSQVPRRSVRGALAGIIDTEALNAFEVALDASKTERIATVRRRWT